MKSSLLKNQKGFTLIEIISVLVILGILAAVAIPKYVDIQNEARTKAAQGQIAEAKGRLNTALAGYILSNSGVKPATGTVLLTYANGKKTNSCPTAARTEGDFTFVCATGAGSSVVITVNSVQTVSLSPVVTGTFNFAD